MPVPLDRNTQDPKAASRESDRSWAAQLCGPRVKLVANGMTPARIVAELPDLEEEDIRQALAVRGGARTRPRCSPSGCRSESGALILVEDTRYRVRKLPIGRA